MRNVVASFNYTSRKRIERERVLIRATPDGEGGKLTLEKLDVTDLGFPADASVILECGSTRTGVLRHDFGAFGALDLPRAVNHPTNQFDGLSMLLKIVDTNEKRIGLILGHCSGLRPEVANSSGSLLPVVAVDLGELVWRLDFDEGRGPELQVNLRIEETHQLYLDPDFRATVLPEVVARIARWTFENRDQSPDSELGESVADWKTLLRSWGFNADTFDDAIEDLDDATFELSRRFAEQNRYATQFIQAHKGDEQ